MYRRVGFLFFVFFFFFLYFFLNLFSHTCSWPLAATFLKVASKNKFVAGRVHRLSGTFPGINTRALTTLGQVEGSVVAAELGTVNLE